MEEDEISLKELIQTVQEYWHYLLSKWKVIGLVGIFGIIIGLYVAIATKPKYKASLAFVVDDGNKTNGLASIASSFGFGGVDGNQSLFSSSNIMEFLKTRTMIEEALLRPMPEKPYQNQTYANFYIKEYELDKNWQEDPDLKKIHFKVGEDRSAFERTKDSILGLLYVKIIEKELTVSQRNKDNSFIEVAITSHSEVFSKTFSEELISVALEYYVKSKTQKAQASVDVLQHQTDSIARALYSSMGGAASSLDQVFGLNPAMLAQRVSSAKEQANVQMNIAILQELVKNLELAKVNLLNNTPVITIVEKPIYPLEIKKIGIVKGGLIGGFLAIFAVICALVGKRYFDSLF